MAKFWVSIFLNQKDSTEIEIKDFFTLNHHEIGEVSSWLTTTWPASLDMTSSGTRTSSSAFLESSKKRWIFAPNKLPANRKSNITNVQHLPNSWQTHDTPLWQLTSLDFRPDNWEPNNNKTPKIDKPKHSFGLLSLLHNLKAQVRLEVQAQLDPNCVFDTWLLGNLWWYLWCVYLILAPGQTTHSSLLKFCISKLDLGFSTSDFPWSLWWFWFQIVVSQPIINHQMSAFLSIFLVDAAQCPSLG